VQCIFVTDLHGRKNLYKKLFKIVNIEKPDGIFLGGDLLPGGFSIDEDIEEFIQDFLISEIKKIKKINPATKFFVIFGNDDPRIFENLFIDASKNKLIEYISSDTVKFKNLYVTGYPYVPPTPFRLKDWEKYDVSRFVDVGAVSPESGMRSIKIHEDKIIYETIADDLELLSKNAPIGKTIYLFHSPPYKSFLDRANLDKKVIDHVPVDVHVGSIAIQRFIKQKQPFLTLHGHVHESTRLTGHWKEKIGKTYSFSAVHDGTELCLVKFDTDNLENATRILL